MQTDHVVTWGRSHVDHTLVMAVTSCSDVLLSSHYWRALQRVNAVMVTHIHTYRQFKGSNPGKSVRLTITHNPLLRVDIYMHRWRTIILPTVTRFIEFESNVFGNLKSSTQSFCLSWISWETFRTLQYNPRPSAACSTCCTWTGTWDLQSHTWRLIHVVGGSKDTAVTSQL